jgi:hypothetical protein
MAEEMISVSKRDLEDLFAACGEGIPVEVLTLKEAASVVRDLHTLRKEMMEEADSICQSLEEILEMVEANDEVVSQTVELSGGAEDLWCLKLVTSPESNVANEAPGVWSAMTSSTVCLLPAGHDGKCKDAVMVLLDTAG